MVQLRVLKIVVKMPQQIQVVVGEALVLLPLLLDLFHIMLVMVVKEL